MGLISGSAVVTGGGAGTGRTIALALGDLGLPVVVADIDGSASRETSEMMQGKGQQCHPLTGNVSDPDVIDEMLTVADSFEGGLAVLINNAGGGGERPPHFPEADAEIWEAKVQLNLIAPMRSTQAALKIMTRRGWGGIVNIASTAGLGLDAYGSPEYAAAKAGLIRFTSCFAKLSSVRVNCIVPGWIATERALAELEAMSEQERQVAEEPTSMTAVAGAVIDLLMDESAMGRALLLEGTNPPRYLGSESI